MLLERDQIRKRVVEQRKVLGTWRTLWATGNQTKRAPPPAPPPPPPPPNAPNAPTAALDGTDEIDATPTPSSRGEPSGGGGPQDDPPPSSATAKPSKFAAAIQHTESARSFWGNVG